VSSLVERLFHRNEGVIRGRAALVHKRVVLVGLGSLGGAVAMALARAGIRRFVLIDPDHVSVENVCRHVVTIDFVGWSKVAALEVMIRGVNPDAEVTPIEKHLAWDLPHLGAGRELEALLGSDDVVVSTCAVGMAERQLNAVAVARGVSALYGAALGAAEHARVFRVIPGETACYECVLLAQERDPAAFPRFRAEGLEAGAGAYLHPELPGLAIDVTQIAMLIARLTLQTIARRAGVEIGMDDEIGDHMLWSNRGRWAICDRALQVAVRDVPRAAECPVCGALSDEEESRP
jgi:molybdopterin/thiamine biosynthesis adenylyltransferase